MEQHFTQLTTSACLRVADV